jgi:hypothetical protein
MAGGEGIAGGDGAGTSTVPSPAPVVGVGNSGDGAAGGATVVSTVDVWTDVVSDVVELVVVSLSALSPPHAVNSDATAIPEARANRADVDALREVTKPRLPVAEAAQPSAA